MEQHRQRACTPSAAATTQRVRLLPSQDADARRARRATTNRILTLLKGALNLAYCEGHATSDTHGGG